jgi:hypothetical protein
MKFLFPAGSSLIGADIAVVRNSPADCFAYIAANSSIGLVFVMNLTVKYPMDICCVGNPLEIFNILGLLMEIRVK